MNLCNRKGDLGLEHRLCSGSSENFWRGGGWGGADPRINPFPGFMSHTPSLAFWHPASKFCSNWLISKCCCNWLLTKICRNLLSSQTSAIIGYPPNYDIRGYPPNPAVICYPLKILLELAIFRIFCSNWFCHWGALLILPRLSTKIVPVSTTLSAPSTEIVPVSVSVSTLHWNCPSECHSVSAICKILWEVC